MFTHRFAYTLTGTTVMSFFSVLFGCGKQQEAIELPELLSSAADGFVDLSFRIVRSNAETDGSRNLVAKALYHGRIVGLRVRLEARWHDANFGEDIVAYQGTLSYSTLWDESDALVKALAQLYGVESDAPSMKNAIGFTGISLQGKPADLSSGPVQIKLFYEPGSDDDYAEVYTNIDLENALLEIREKDPEYRRPLLRALVVAAS